MTDAFDAAIAAGRAALRERNFADAIRHYQDALAINADDAEAQSLCGAALTQAGRIEEAEPLLLNALEKAPDEPGYRLNLAQLYRAAGRFDEAIAQLAIVTADAPEIIQAWVMLGESHMARKDFQDAADAFDSALQRDSGKLQIALRLARAQAAAGNYPAAFYALEHADKISPNAPETLRARLDIARFNRDWKAVAKFAEQLIGLQPEDAAVWRDLAVAFYEQGMLRAAMEAFERVLDLAGRTPANLTAYAGVALQAARPDKAGEALDEAEQYGSDAALNSTQALRYLQQGDLERALSYCEEALALDPEYLPVYPHLIALRKGKLKAAEIEALERKVGDERLPPSPRSMAGFVLGRHYDAEGEFDRAFEEYQRANMFAREQRRLERIEYVPADAERVAEEIRSLFSSPEDFQRFGDGQSERAATPIFIMGAPRSGTTLVESVIGAHSRVRVGGELPAIATLLNLFGRRGAFAGAMTAEERENYLNAYWAQAPELEGADYLTDKALLNLNGAGLAAQMFPQAPIIRVRRNPIETGFSIYSHEFTKFWAFTDDLAMIAHFLAENERMAAHWSEMLGDRFVTLQYEDFVRDFENQAKKLVAACGLEWEDACASRDGEGAPSATISAAQIREPVTLSGRADAYRRHLEPLIKALEEEGIDLETGALTSS